MLIAKKYARGLTLFAGMLALVFLFSLAGPAHAQTIIPVDQFDSGPQGFAVFGVGSQQSAATGTMLGGHRKVSVQQLATGQFATMNVDTTDGVFQMGVSSLAQYITTVTWDGTSDLSQLSYNLNANLVGTPQVADGILLSILGWEGNNIDIHFRIYTDATNYSEATYLVRGDSFIAPYDVALCFFEGCFTATGPDGGANFTSVGAIVMVIESIEPGADIDISLTFAGPARDFGDLPESYTTEIASTTSALDPNEEGARHSRGNIYLGTCVSTELNGQPADNAGLPDGDDCDDGIEPVGSTATGGDGVRWVGGAGGGSVEVTWTSAFANGRACLDGWIDWHYDVATGGSPNTFLGTTGPVPGGGTPSYTAAQKHVVRGQLLLDTSGYPFAQTVTFDVPTNYFDTEGGPAIGLASRWRIYPADSSGNCPIGGLGTDGYKGYIINGEVEDYIWGFQPTAVTLQSFSPAASHTPVVALVGFLSLAIVAFGLVIVRRERRA